MLLTEYKNKRSLTNFNENFESVSISKKNFNARSSGRYFYKNMMRQRQK